MPKGSFLRPWYLLALDAAPSLGKLRFSRMASSPMIAEETLRDFEYPQREAAFFYGLFLRGHSAEELRRDIEVPAQVLARWHREAEREPTFARCPRAHGRIPPARAWPSSRRWLATTATLPACSNAVSPHVHTFSSADEF